MNRSASPSFETIEYIEFHDATLRGLAFADDGVVTAEFGSVSVAVPAAPGIVRLWWCGALLTMAGVEGVNLDGQPIEGNKVMEAFIDSASASSEDDFMVLLESPRVASLRLHLASGMKARFAAAQMHLRLVDAVDSGEELPMQ